MHCRRCCLQGQFLYAAKAFDVLERLDGSPEHWEGKQGACVGVLQMVAAGKETGETLRSADWHASACTTWSWTMILPVVIVIYEAHRGLS